MRTDEIVGKWNKHINRKYYNKLHNRVRQDIEAAKKEEVAGERLEIWLGGPGKGTPLYRLRHQLKRLLESWGFSLTFSEDYWVGADLAAKETDEVESLDLIIILAITPGASAEAIEFGHFDHLRRKLYVYTLRRYRDGYVYNVLKSRYGLIRDGSLFTMRNATGSKSNLALNMVDLANSRRLELFRAKKLQRELNTQ
jgi:hypothetical protein